MTNCNSSSIFASLSSLPACLVEVLGVFCDDGDDVRALFGTWFCAM